jgi:hypothetical protein
MTVHASVAELEEYIGKGAPADAERLLKRASELIDTYVLAPYLVDSSGVATDADVLASLRDAVCAQVEWWIGTGDDADVALAYKSIQGLGAERTRNRLAPRAKDHLRSRRLTQVGAF